MTSTTKILANSSLQVCLSSKAVNKHLEMRRFFQPRKNKYLDIGHALVFPISMKSEFQVNKFFVTHHCAVRKNSLSNNLETVFINQLKLFDI